MSSDIVAAIARTTNSNSGNKVRLEKPAIVLMSLTGALATRAFMTVSPESKAFIRANLKQYLRENWGRKQLRVDTNYLRLEQLRQQTDEREPQGSAIQTQGPPPLSSVNSSSREQVASLISNIIWRLDKDEALESPAAAVFQMHLRDWAYDKGILKTPVYDEVTTVLKKWKNEDGVKVYIALGSQEFLNRILQNTTYGDLMPLIDGPHNLMQFDGSTSTKKNFSNLAEHFKVPASKILFISRSTAECRLASKAKINLVLILREDFEPEADSKLTEATRLNSERQQRKRLSAASTTEDKKGQPVKRKKMSKSPSRTTSLVEAVHEMASSSSPGDGDLELGSNLSEMSSNIDSMSSELHGEEDDQQFEPQQKRIASRASLTDLTRMRSPYSVIRRLDDLVWE